MRRLSHSYTGSVGQTCKKKEKKKRKKGDRDAFGKKSVKKRDSKQKKTIFRQNER